MIRYLLHHPTAAGLAGLIGVPGVWAVVTFTHNIMSNIDHVRF